jgi:hypothetical protein
MKANHIKSRNNVNGSRRNENLNNNAHVEDCKIGENT